MILYYEVLAGLSILFTVVMLCTKKKTQMESYFLYIFITILVANMGFYYVATSENVREALLAMKITYAGISFLPPLFMFIVLDVCNIKAPAWIRVCSSLIGIIVFTAAMTIGSNELYYKNPRLEFVLDGAVLLKEYGSLHFLFPVLLYGFVASQIGIIIFAFIKKKNMSYRNVIILIVAELATALIYAVGRILPTPVLLQPLAFVIDDIAMLYIAHRVQLYHISDSISLALIKEETHGYITFDNKKKYLGANDMAKKLLPELEDCVIDRHIKSTSNVINELIGWMEELAIKMGFHGKAGAVLTKELSLKNRHLKCKVRAIQSGNGKKLIAYIYEISDNTVQHNYTNLLSAYNSELEETVKKKTEHIANIQIQLVLGMSDVIENRDGNTGGHVKRTSDIVAILVRNIEKYQLFSLSEDFCQDIIKAAPMHDLGKIAIPDAILNKPGKLTLEEFDTMKSHPVKSAGLVKSILEGVEEEHFVRVATNVARYHHEKWNGNGYPEGLRGEEIPFEARIMALADVYDALVSRRTYKKAMSFKEAYATIDEDMGIHFDPALRALFMLSNKDLENYYIESGSHTEVYEGGEI